MPVACAAAVQLLRLAAPLPVKTGVCRTEFYLGHRIDAEARRHDALGGWYWAYLIDGRVQSRGKVRQPESEAALRSALCAAEARVDAMVRTVSAANFAAAAPPRGRRPPRRITA